MIYAACITFLFLLMQLMNALLNFIFRQKLGNQAGISNEKISVLIPARNEEANIGHLLDDLTADNKDNIEILVYDDQSADNTASIVRNYLENDPRIKLLNSVGLPDGWLGKNHACYQLARNATGRFLLFLDADVRISGDAIEAAVEKMKRHSLGMLTIFPVQIQKTFGEKASVPIMNYILLTLLPLIFVHKSPFKSHAAANGQFMLFDKSIYKSYEPHRLFRGSAVEDIAIARFMKKQKVKIACLTGEKRVQCRMYMSYSEALDGFSKNIFHFFGKMPLVAFAFWLTASFGFIPVIAALPGYLSFYLAGVAAVQILYSAAARQNIVVSTLLFPLHLAFMFQVLVKALYIKRHRNYLWKGRNIYS